MLWRRRCAKKRSQAEEFVSSAKGKIFWPTASLGGQTSVQSYLMYYQNLGLVILSCPRSEQYYCRYLSTGIGWYHDHNLFLLFYLDPFMLMYHAS